MNWHLVLTYAVSGAIVSWPACAVTLWAAHRSTRAHVDKVTRSQTAQIRQITDSQTGTLLSRLRAGYHGHERDEDC